MPTAKAQPDYYSGRVHSVAFSDESKAFYVVSVVLDGSTSGGLNLDSNVVTVRGSIPGVRIAVGTWFGFEGVWDDHPKYGRQLKITRAPVLKNGWDDDTCEKILISQEIGATLAATIRKHLQGDLITALADPERLKTVPGVTTFTAELIAHKWKMARAQFQTMDFLGDLGLPQGKIRQVWELFGDEAKEVLSVDPWRLLKLDGITFEDCDTVAKRLNLDCSPSNPNRIKGVIVYAARSSRSQGHLFLSSAELLDAVRALDPMMMDRDIAQALKDLMVDKRVVVDRSFPKITAIYDLWSYHTETTSARLLKERLTTAVIQPDRADQYVKSILGEAMPGLSLRDAGARYLTQVGSSLGITLSPKQTEAVLNALTEAVSIITGLPGSGKTTSLRMALTLLQEAGLQPLVVAPTGIAAKRVESVTGVQAYTIHRALGARGLKIGDGRKSTYAGVVGDRDAVPISDGSGEAWSYGPDNPHLAEVMVIDESSMVDQALLYRILTCTRPDCRLVFVGDAAQLPSVGAGNVLRDLIASGQFPTVSLTEIFRQADTSPIITAAHDTFHGRVPAMPIVSDFSLIPLSKEEEILKMVLSTAEKLHQQQKDFQVLSPRHAGILGVTNLNTRLRTLINPAQHGLHEVTIGGEVLREGDRVIVCKNDYDLEVFNGDIARVDYIDKNSKQIEIEVCGPPVFKVRISWLNTRPLLRLAYAVTVHRCQGLEYDVVVMPIVESFAHQLQRNLFYTAITRARKKVILIGSRRAVERSVYNNREDARNTLLSQRLLKAVQE